MVKIYRWLHELYQKTFKKLEILNTFDDNLSNRAIVPSSLKEKTYHGDRKGKGAGS